MSTPGSTGSADKQEINGLLAQGFQAAKEGRRAEAYNVFHQVVQRDSSNELGWLYRAATTGDLSEAYICLQRVLTINPANLKAQRGLERIQERLTSQAEPPVTPVATASIAATAANSSDHSVEEPALIGEQEIVSNLDLSPAASLAASPAEDTEQASSDITEPAQPFGHQEEIPTNNDLVVIPEAASAVRLPPYRPSFEERYAAKFSRPGARAESEQVGHEGALTPPGGQDNQAAIVTAAASPMALEKAVLPLAAAPAVENLTGLDATGQAGGIPATMLLKLMLALLALVILAIIAVLLLQPRSNNPVSNQAVVATVPVVGSTNAIVAPATWTAAAPTSMAATVTSALTTQAAALILATTGPLATTAAPTTSPVPATTTAFTATIAPAPTATVVPTNAVASPTPVPATAVPTLVPPTVPPPPTPTPVTPPRPRAIAFLVKSGDNLTRIAEQYNTSVEAIRAANAPGLVAANGGIFTGTTLIIPVQRPDFRGRDALILRPGQTLQALANLYQINVDELSRYNGFAAPGEARPGDAILIP